jgi:cilia- and flagella-associated protein 52
MSENGDGGRQLLMSASTGFDGSVARGVCAHPDGQHAVYATGSTIVVKNFVTEAQRFLHGHSDRVTCIAVSHDGTLIASGQRVAHGYKSRIILWDFETGARLETWEMHNESTVALSFSKSDLYLASLGGPDDNHVVVWDLKVRTALGGALAAREADGTAKTVQFSNTSDHDFFTGGENTLRLWHIDYEVKRLRPVEAQVGSLKRVITSIVSEPDDSVLYAATTTGDVLRIELNIGNSHAIFRSSGPKQPFVGGVSSISLHPDGQSVVVGTAAGLVALVRKPALQVTRKRQLEGAITSLAFLNGSILAGTSSSNLHSLNAQFDAKMELTSHTGVVSQVVFAANSDRLLISCGDGDIRIWDSWTSDELVRITVKEHVCKCVAMLPSGRGIVSGWDDGKLRIFSPQTGALLFDILDAHPSGIAALAVSTDGTRFISGGSEGMIRVWDITTEVPTMLVSLKEHKSAITQIRMTADDEEAVSTSMDGSVITWDLIKFLRLKCMFAPSALLSCDYLNDESQILTVGNDKKIAYWDTADGSLLRELEASTTGTIRVVAMLPEIPEEVTQMITAGDDRRLKLWEFDSGKLVKEVSVGGAITSAVVCDDGSRIATATSDGSIFVWSLM